jgi:hypothetical protein
MISGPLARDHHVLVWVDVLSIPGIILGIFVFLMILMLFKNKLFLENKI